MLTSSIRIILTSGDCVDRARVGVFDIQGDFDGVDSIDAKEKEAGLAGVDGVDTDEGVGGADERLEGVTLRSWQHCEKIESI